MALLVSVNCWLCRSEASLLLHRVRQEDRGRYMLRYASSHFSGSQEVNLRVFGKDGPFLSVVNESRYFGEVV